MNGKCTQKKTVMETNVCYIYEAGDVRVTSNLLIIGDSHYRIGDVNAVFISKTANYRRYPICLGLFALLMALSAFYGGANGFGLSCMLVAGGCFVGAYLMKTRYVLRLRTRFGETRLLTSTDRYELEQIKTGVVKALKQEASSCSTV